MVPMPVDAPRATIPKPPAAVAATIAAWGRGEALGSGVFGWWVRLAGQGRYWHLAVPGSAPEFALEPDAPAVGKVEGPPPAACGLEVDSFSFQCFSNRDITPVCSGCLAELPRLAAGYTRTLTAGVNELEPLAGQLGDDTGAVWLKATLNARSVAGHRDGETWDQPTYAALAWLAGAYEQLARRAAELAAGPAAADAAATDALMRCLAASFDEIVTEEAGAALSRFHTLFTTLKVAALAFVRAASQPGADLDAVSRSALSQIAATRKAPSGAELTDWALGRAPRAPQLTSSEFADLGTYLQAEWSHWHNEVTGRVITRARQAAAVLSDQCAARPVALEVSLASLGSEGVDFLGRAVAPFAPVLTGQHLAAEVPAIVALACYVELGADVVEVAGSPELDTCLALHGTDIVVLADALAAAAALSSPPARSSAG